MTEDADQLTTPRYVQAFACIGAKCPTTCCGGWRIQVDQATHQHWQTISIEPLRTALRNSARLTAPEDSPSKANHAYLVLGEDKHCPLLTPEKLCSVHSQLGEAALPQICHDFPRAHARAGERISVHCSLACPEAARLALTDAAAMDLVTAPMPPSARAAHIAPHRNRSALGLASDDDLANESLDCVQASAEVFAQTARRLIARPELNATQAWLLFSMAVIKAGKAARAAPTKRDAVMCIQRELAAMLEPDDLLALAHSFAQLTQSAHDVHQLLELAHGITSPLARENNDAPFARGVLPKAFSAFGFDADDEAEQAAASLRFAQAESQWFEPFDNAHPHLLKNVVLNDIGRNNFPTADLAGLTKLTLHVWKRLSMIRLFIVGRAALTRERFGVSDYVEVVTSFARWVENNRRFRGTPFFVEGAAEDARPWTDNVEL
jgi:lysine-N-methylase